MEFAYFLFEFPDTLFKALKSFADFMATPIEDGLVRLFLDIFDTIWWIYDKLDIFGIIPNSIFDFLHEFTDILYGAPLAMWLILICIAFGVVFTILFFIVDLIDRLNFFT